MLKDYEKDGLSETTEIIADTLNKKGLAGSTILELGCGFGALSLELLRKGAASAVGMDLSPKMIELAHRLATEAGLSKSVSFEQGDGASADLRVSDIVILDAVLCCYPDAASLVENSSDASRRYYAFSVPDDGRLATKFLRVLLPIQSIILRRGSFRFFIHSTRRIKERLEKKGFKLVSKSAAGWIWSVFVFAAPGVS
jgi:magnesium-protoporphyrin O-methyltransferase